MTLNPSDLFGDPIIDLGYYTDSNDFDITAMTEALKLTQTFYDVPSWKDYIISQTSPAQNATDAEIRQYIRNTTATVYYGVGTAVMSAKDATYGVVDPDPRVKGASGLRIIDALVIVNP